MKKKYYGNALIVSCILHSVGLLLGTLFIVQNEIYENAPIRINIARTIKNNPKRRLEKRRKTQIELKQKVPKAVLIKPQTNVVTTAAQLPMSNTFYTLPTSNTSSFVEQHRFSPRSVYNAKLERKTPLNVQSINTFSKMPLDNLLVETDSPFLSPVPMRGKKNEPSYIKYTLNKLAELKKFDSKKIDEVTTINFNKLFFN